MGIPILGTIPRDVGGGFTGTQAVADFIKIRMEGEEELIAALLRAAVRAGVEARGPLNAACKEALKPIMQKYKENVPQVTGNLHRSIEIRNIKGQRARGVGAAIGGPTHVKTGKEWDVETKGAGNHAWLVEFGTGRRRPGTQGRRTLINLHRKTNKGFRRIGDSTQWVRNDEFDRLGRGNYFIMSSYNSPNRKRGQGYPHDFFMAIEPGETYGEMPARHAMQRALGQARSAAMSTLTDALRAQIAKITRAA